METIDQNLWEEKNSTEVGTNCSNNSEFDPSVTINYTKNDSTKDQCNTIGKLPYDKKRYRREYYLKNKARELENHKKYYSTNKEKCLNIAKNSYTKNKDVINHKKKQNYLQNKEVISSKHKLYHIQNKDKLNQNSKNYRMTHPDKIRQYNKMYGKTRKMSDINFRIGCNLRSRMNAALKANQKAGSSVRDLGCSIPEFKQYIEKKWLVGMTWVNWNKCGWHLDHIIPLSSFDLTKRDQFLAACHYTNFQPLWARDNIKKGNRFL